MNRHTPAECVAHSAQVSRTRVAAFAMLACYRGNDTEIGSARAMAHLDDCFYSLDAPTELPAGAMRATEIGGGVRVRQQVLSPRE